MPQKALVALGVVLGFALLVLSVPGRCSAADALEQAGSRPSGMATKVTEEQLSSPTTEEHLPNLDAALSRTLRQSPKLSACSREVGARESEA